MTVGHELLSPNGWKDSCLGRRIDGIGDDGHIELHTYRTMFDGQKGKINTPSLMDLYEGSGIEGGNHDVKEQDQLMHEIWLWHLHLFLVDQQLLGSHVARDGPITIILKGVVLGDAGRPPHQLIEAQNCPFLYFS
jgi:hypothetical protein